MLQIFHIILIQTKIDALWKVDNISSCWPLLL